WAGEHRRRRRAAAATAGRERRLEDRFGQQADRQRKRNTEMSREGLHPDADYRRHLADGRFMLQRSRSSGAFVFHPRVAEPGSGATDLEWVEACGRGSVYSTTIVRCKPPAADYNVALIDLVEGPRMMSRVVGIAAAD